jgi:phosphatidylserine/phosphatidylglycerophosphate/cardiolipin synthase-like enzyme
VKLIIQPDEGITPVLHAVKRAKKSIDIVIFRFDRPELEKAIAAAVSRGVTVRALIAHTNRRRRTSEAGDAPAGGRRIVARS